MENKEKTQKSDEQWKKELSPKLYHIAREKGTEPAFTGKYYKTKDEGIYQCSVCKNPLFSSDTKYDSGSGWPSFYKPIDDKNVGMNTDNSFEMDRTEIVCNHCGAHLGHVFDDGPKTMPSGEKTTGKRFCINSLSLDLEKKFPPQEKSLPEKKLEEKISLEYFQKVKLKTAKILSAEKVTDSDKLLKLMVELQSEKRQIIAGIGKNYMPENLIGKTVIIISNLESKKLAGLESQGMLLAFDSEDGPVLMVPEREVGLGRLIK